MVQRRRAAPNIPAMSSGRSSRRSSGSVAALVVLFIFTIGTAALAVRSLTGGIDETPNGAALDQAQDAPNEDDPTQGGEFDRATARREVALAEIRAGEQTPDPDPSPEIEPGTNIIHVDDKAEVRGEGTVDQPFLTLGEALELAQPGDVVLIGRGVYRERVRSVRAGTPDRPIRIIGEDGARLESDGRDHLVRITHDHIWLENLKLSDAKTLIWIENATGVRVLRNTLTDAGGECIRLKYFARRNEIAYNDIGKCGRTGFDLSAGSKNGEAVYIGTAPEQLESTNPSLDPDRSDRNWVHHNTISARAECVDVKESATANRVEDNVCLGGDDPKGAGFSSRGRGTIFVRNTSSDHAGSGIQLAGDDHEIDAAESVVVDNAMSGNGAFGLRVLNPSQTLLCANVFDDNDDGDMSELARGAGDPCPES